MPPMQPNRQQQAAQRCPGCGGEPMRGSKKGSPTCAVCHGDMATSPAGKQAMSQASKAGAQKVRQAMQQRQQMAQREQAQRRMIAGAGRPGMGVPGVAQQGWPQGQQIDPRAAMLLQALAQRGGR